jgi:hypothetical protein
MAVHENANRIAPTPRPASTWPGHAPTPGVVSTSLHAPQSHSNLEAVRRSFSRFTSPPVCLLLVTPYLELLVAHPQMDENYLYGIDDTDRILLDATSPLVSLICVLQGTPDCYPRKGEYVRENLKGGDTP